MNYKAPLIIVLILLAISIPVILYVNYYLQNTEIVTMKGKVIEKYLYSETDVVINVDGGVGIPIKSKKYILVLEDYSEHEVAYEIFISHRVGDYYHYTVRVWKD